MKTTSGSGWGKRDPEATKVFLIVSERRHWTITKEFAIVVTPPRGSELYTATKRLYLTYLQTFSVSF